MSEYIFVTNIFEYSNIRIYSSHSGMEQFTSVSNHPICQNSQLSSNSDTSYEIGHQIKLTQTQTFLFIIKTFCSFLCIWMKGYIIQIDPAVDTEGKDDKDEKSSRGAFVVHGYHLYFFSSDEEPLRWRYTCDLWFLCYHFFPDEESELRDISGRRLCRPPQARIRWARGGRDQTAF